jgi:hypothetical protein
MINIDTNIIKAIHRGPDGYVGFCRKTQKSNRIFKNGKPVFFENLFSIPIEEIEPIINQQKAWLRIDSYFTINTPYRTAHGPKNRRTKLPNVERKEVNLRYLNACYLDIDCGRTKSENPFQKRSVEKTFIIIKQLIENNVIPAPSITAKSGRGIYIFYLLRRNENSNLPPEARPEKISAYKTINKELGKKCMDYLPWDKSAFDAARVLRTPGSIHSNTNQTVKYEIQYDQNQKPIMYTMPQLAEFVGLKTKAEKSMAVISNPKEQLYRTTIKKGSTPKRRKSQIELKKKRVQDILTIEKKRGGYQKGKRRRVITIYAECLYHFNDKEKTLIAAKQLAARCKPPFPSDANDQSVESIVRHIYSRKPGCVRRWTNQKLCYELEISPEMARELNLITIIPDVVKAERNAMKPMRKIDAEKRHKAIKLKLKQYPLISVRNLEKILMQEGICASRATIARDLKKIRYEIKEIEKEAMEQAQVQQIA